MPKIEVKIWNFFEKSSWGNKIATCNYCHRELSYKTTVTNLKSHLKTKHPDVYNNGYVTDTESEPANVIYIAEFDDDDNIQELYEKSQKSNVPIWNYFQESLKGNKLAICNYCLREFSFKTSITNLKTHLKQKHITVYNEFLSLSRSSNVSNSSSTSDDEATPHDEELYVENTSAETKTSKGDQEIWNFFEKSTDGNRTAVCNYCLRNITFNNEVANLKLHLKTDHTEVYRSNFKSTDIPENDDNGPSPADDGELIVEYISPETKRRTRDVPIWKFFEPTDDGNRTAICNNCGRTLSYKTTITNLKSHLQQKHIEIYNLFLNLSGALPENLANSSTLSESDFEESYLEDSSSETKKHKSGIPIWNFFERSNDGDKTAICNYCHREISFRTTITNLKVHLKQKHVAAYKKLIHLQDTVHSDVRNTTSFRDNKELHAEDGIGKRKTVSCGIEAGRWYSNDGDTDEPSRKIKKMIPTDLSNKLKIDNRNNINLNLLKMIVYDFQPFSLVNDIGFRAYTQALNPNYKIPDQKALSDNLLSEVYEKRLEGLKEFVSVHAKSVCITVDCWTSCTMDNFMAITAHFVTEDPVELKSILIGCGEFDSSEDGTNKKIKKIVEDWGIYNKVNSIVTNNADYMEKSAKQFKIDGWSHFVCFAQKLNIVVQEAFCEIKDTIFKVRTIVNHILKSATAEEDLFKYQTNELKMVIGSSPTRWNTAYLMVQRFIEMKESLEATVLNLETNLPIISEDEWQCLDQISIILKPFYEATLEMSVDKYLVASKAFILTSNLINICNSYSELQELHPLVRAFANKLKDNITYQFGNIESNETIGLCTILDPRFKLKGIKNKEKVDLLKNKIRTVIDEINQETLNDSEKAGSSTSTADPITLQAHRSELVPFSLWCEFDEDNKTSNGTTDDELEKYLTGALVKRTECPLKYWQQYKCVYPTLFKLFIRYCNIMVTSVACEQIFSESGYITSYRRTLLSTPKIAQIMFLHANKM